MTFVKGQSGNPGGRRLDSKQLELRDLARKGTRSAMATILTIMRNKDNAPAVRLTAAGMVLDRGHGKAIQPVANPDLTPLNLGDMETDDLVKLAAKVNVAAAALAQDTLDQHKH